MKSIAVIITCHNRKEKTLKCLDQLFSQNDVDNTKLNVYLVDDGSTDGTGDAVRKKYPQANIIQGDGTLYWNGGMRLAFAKAMEIGYDYYLWLNDDTFLYPSAIQILVDSAKLLKSQNGKDNIVTGTIIDGHTNKINYGGRFQKDKLHPLTFLLITESSIPQICDTFNGNVAFIEHSVTDKIGNISKEFSRQHGGDLDYGLRAKYAGIDTWVAPGIIGECTTNPLEDSIYDKSLTIRERMKMMKSPRGVPPAIEWMIFSKRHSGWLWPYFWLRTTVRVIFPWTYLLLRKPTD